VPDNEAPAVEHPNLEAVNTGELASFEDIGDVEFAAAEAEAAGLLPVSAGAAAHADPHAATLATSMHHSCYGRMCCVS